MSHLHTPTSARGGSRLDDPRYLFSAEAREAIRRHPSMTPVPLFHQPPHHHHAATSHTNSQLTSPSALSSGTSLSSSAQPLDHRSLASSAVSSYMSTGLIRPQPRSPHDAEAWDSNSPQLATHSPFQQTYGAYPHYQHPHMPVLPSMSTISLPASPSSTSRPTAPFFASLAKHSTLSLASPNPSRPYLPAAVSVYGQFDSTVWQRTPLPKSLSGHPMAMAQSEARRQREEWERENNRLWELERERDQLLRRGEERQRMQQEMHMRAMHAQDEAAQQEQHTPVVVKRGSAAAIGSRPSVSLRRSAQSADAGFVTPAAKPRRRPESTSEMKKGRVQSAVIEMGRDDRKESATNAGDKEERRRDEATLDDGLSIDKRSDQGGRKEATDEEEARDDDESDQREDKRTNSDTEDEEDGVTHCAGAEADEEEASAVPLSPVKKRSSNRIYTVPLSTHALPTSASAPLSALPALPPAPAGLKPDMSLSRWYFHILQSSPLHAPRIVIKGTHATEGPWSSGYVLDRERMTGRVLLTNSRRYVLLGDMDEAEMEYEGWSERMRRACTDGLPSEWKDWLMEEAEQCRQVQQEREAKRVSFDFVESEQRVDDRVVQQKEEVHEEEEKEEPISRRRLSPLIRARRSPAPIRHTEWWEDEVMRLVEAVSMHNANDNDGSSFAASSDTVELWKRVADEVGGGRRWEECRRKFDEVRREQSRGIKKSEKRKDRVKRLEDRKEGGSDKKGVKNTDRTRKGEEKSTQKTTKRSLLTPAAAAALSARKLEKKAAIREWAEETKQHEWHEETEAKDVEQSNGNVTQLDEDVALGQFHATTAPDGVIGRAAVTSGKKRTKKPKQPTAASLPSFVSPRTHAATTALLSFVAPRTPAAASVEHAVLNPHDVAYTHTRRSGRAVMAPLKHWELEREVNGVILRGFQHGGEAIRRVLTEKMRMEKDEKLHVAQSTQQYTAGTRRKAAGERKAKARAWSADEREQLRLAYMWVEPSEKGFWLSMSRFMAGRTPEECQAEYEKMYPTPKRRGKRKGKAAADEDEEGAEEKKEDGAGGKEEATDEGGGQAKRRKRVTTIKREIRDALDSRQQQHSGDDLFDSTPYKGNAELTHTAPQPQPNDRHKRRSNQSQQESSADSEEAEGSLLFAGDTALADMQIQRVVKERRKVRANKGQVVEAERRRQGKEGERSRRGERLAEGSNELRLGVRRLEAEDNERKQERMDEMDDDDDVDEDDDEQEGDDNEIVQVNN